MFSYLGILGGTAGGGGGGGGPVAIGDVTGLQAALDGKAASSHTHAIGDVTNLTSDLAGKEPTIGAGTTAEYWRGDKSWQTLNKSAVGLGNADNTSDANKPISTATQAALDAKQATLVSGTNIKTVNGSSLLGSGDLSVSGGSNWPQTQTVEWWEEFFTSSGWAGGLSNQSNGGSHSIVNSQQGAPGILQTTTSTSSTGRGTMMPGGTTTLEFGAGAVVWESRHYVSSLSDGTDTYTLRVGFFDLQNADAIDGLYFRYTHSVNGGNWQAVARRASSETAVDMGVGPVTSGWQKLKIEVNEAGTSVDFIIDSGTPVTITTNIPGAGNHTSYGFTIHKSAGTTARQLFTDYCGLKVMLAVER